jgi:hypothetical protein
MSDIDWFEICVVIFFTIAFVLAYRIGLLFDARWPAVSAPVFVLLGVGALILSWTAAVQVSGKEQASCDESHVTTDRLNGSSRSEFRERCMATPSGSNDLAWRRTDVH